jgi:hypothetical protein
MKKISRSQKIFAAAFSFFLLYTFAALNAGHSSAQRQTKNFSPPKKLNWYKGNTHTHTTESDGDSTPDEVARWYREQGYNFLVLSDHNTLTGADELNKTYGAAEKFLLIEGEEVSAVFDKKPVHINGLNIERVVKPQSGKTLLETIQRNVNAIREARGVPHINHPNFGWTISAAELKQVENNRLFEIFNGHPLVNNFGGGGKPSLEEMWDAILTSGKLLYGIAVDDAHHFKRPWDKRASRPGQGWIVVRAERLAASAILEAMERGDFYASTGVELEDYEANEKSITIKIREERSSKYRVQFIGKNGRVLNETITNPAVYQFRGDEGYVRAKIFESNGKVAWTQPVIVGAR